MHGIWILRRGFQISGSGLKSLSVQLEFWISIVSGIQVFLSCIPDSKAQDSTLHRQSFPGFRNPDSLTDWTTPCYCFCFHYEIFISCTINRSNQSKSSSYFDLLALRNANLSQENKFIKIIKLIKIHR